MRWSDGLIIAFYTFVVFVLGVLVTGIALELIPSGTVLMTLDEITQNDTMRLKTTVAGGLLMLISLATLRMIIRRTAKNRHISYKTESGQVQVSIHALEDLVKDIGREFLDVKSVRPSIRVRRNLITACAALELYSGTQVSTLAQRLQDRIKTQLENLLGNGVRVSTNIVVRHVDRKPKEHNKHYAADRSMQFGSDSPDSQY